MGHESIRDYVDNADELYAVLKRLEPMGERQIGGRALVCLGLLALGLVAPGPWGATAHCLAAMAGLATVGSIADYTARHWFMHLLTLHEIIRPRDELATTLLAVLRAEQAQVAAGEALQAASAVGVGQEHHSDAGRG